MVGRLKTLCGRSRIAQRPHQLPITLHRKTIMLRCKKLHTLLVVYRDSPRSQVAHDGLAHDGFIKNQILSLHPD